MTMLMIGKIEDKGRRGDRGCVGWMASLTFSGHEFEEALGNSEGQREAWCAADHGV